MTRRLLAGAALLALVPLAVRDTFFLNALILTCLFGTMAQAWNLIGGYAGQISFGHAAFFGIGAYTVAILLARHGVNPWVGMWAGAALAAAAALAVGFPTFRLRRHFFALATLALAEIGRILFLNWPYVGAAVGLYLPLEYRNRLAYLMWDSKPPYYLAALALFVAATLLVAAVDRHRLGTYLRAINADEDAAEMLGLPTRRYKLYAMALSAAITALAGGLYALYVLYIDPYNVMAGRLSLLAVVIALIGGRATVWGPPLGALFIVLLSEYTRSWLGGRGAGLDFILFGLAIMLVSIREPGGLAGLLGRRSAGGSEPAEEGTVPAVAAESAPQATADRAARRAASADAPLPADTGAREATRARPGEAILRVHGVWKRFGGVQALRGASLDVRPREICGLIGPNGAGKTTLFECITGFVGPDRGTITVAGRPVIGRRPHEVAWAGLSRTFQAMRVFRDLTVWENLMCAQEHRGESLWDAAVRGDPPDAAARARSLLARLRLSGLEQRPAGALSYGQQKLLSIAMAVLRRPSIVLLDEPAAGVNPALVEVIGRHIRALSAEGMTVLVIEHNMDMVMGLADRVVFMAGGETIADGPPEAIQANAQVRDLYYGH